MSDWPHGIKNTGLSLVITLLLSPKYARSVKKQVMATQSHSRHCPAWLQNWLERHQNPVSFWLHMVGIPITIAAIPLALMQLADDRWDLWWRPAALIAAGYFLQWVGHLIEGNDMGELILVKKLLGKPYVAVAPQYQQAHSETTQANG